MYQLYSKLEAKRKAVLFGFDFVEEKTNCKWRGDAVTIQNPPKDTVLCILLCNTRTMSYTRSFKIALIRSCIYTLAPPNDKFPLVLPMLQLQYTYALFGY